MNIDFETIMKKQIEQIANDEIEKMIREKVKLEQSIEEINIMRAKSKGIKALDKVREETKSVFSNPK